jgi:hypothetical protein
MRADKLDFKRMRFNPLSHWARLLLQSEGAGGYPVSRIAANIVVAVAQNLPAICRLPARAISSDG